MFKRFSVGILCACVSVWLFAACGGGGDNNSNSNSNTNSNTNSNSNSNGNENNNGGTGDCSTNPTYKACIQPIFQKSCGKAGECHGEGSKSGNLTLVGTSAADLQRDGEGFNSKDKGLKIVAPTSPMKASFIRSFWRLATVLLALVRLVAKCLWVPTPLSSPPSTKSKSGSKTAPKTTKPPSLQPLMPLPLPSFLSKYPTLGINCGIKYPLATYLIGTTSRLI